MIPETRAFHWKGLRITRYALSGSTELAQAALNEHAVVFWEKHGIVSVSHSPSEAFHIIDTLVKSALIHSFSKSMGYTPDGLSAAQLNEMKDAYGLIGDRGAD